MISAKVIRSSDIAACSKRSLLPAHYRDDGTRRCSERAETIAAYEAAREASRRAHAEMVAAKRRVDET